jgi:predicted Fe-Mo cluster-binding NifX family protein
MTGGTLTSKVFETLSEAIRFSVYKIPTGEVQQITKVEE